MVAIRASKFRIAKSLRGIDLTNIRVRQIDAENQIVGHLAGQIAFLLQGKDKPTYLPSRDLGDVCVVENAAKVVFTEKEKWSSKLYRWHSGYPGGLKERTAKDTFARRPEDILWRAVSGMLPKNHLREARLRKLLIFAERHGLQDVELHRWEMPEKLFKKLANRPTVPAPPVKK